MKKLTLLLGLLTVLYASAFATNSSSVTHVILKPTPHIVPMTINNMPTINRIFDVGDNAFAVDYKDKLISFFNGTQWSAGVNPAGANAIDSFQPANPITGKTSEAWVEDGKNIYHFDGSKWVLDGSLNTRLGIQNPASWQLDLTSAGGYIFLLGYQGQNDSSQTTPIRYAVYNPTSKQWSKPGLINDYHTDFGTTMFIAYDVTHPHAILQVQPGTTDTENDLLQINADGTNQIVRPNLPKQFDNSISFFTSGASIFDVQEDDSQANHLFYNTTSSAQTWNGLSAPSTGQQALDQFPDDSNISQGLVCLDYPGPQSFQVACINMNATSPKWTPLTKLAPVFDYENDSFILTTVNHGFWLGYKPTHTAANHLVYFNADTNKVTDTNFTYASSSQFATVRPISENQVISCVMDFPKPKSPITLYTYDTTARQQTWHKLDTSTINVNTCGMSTSGGEQVLKMPARNFWLFSESMERGKAASSKTHLHKYLDKS